MLQELGLDAVSERVYRALLEEPSLDEAALARSLRLTRAQIEATLDHLADLALLRTSRENPEKQHPVSLERAVTLLVQSQEAELEARRKALLEGKAAAAELKASAVRSRSRIPAGVEQITALDEIQLLLESLIETAATEVRSMVPTVMSVEALQVSRALDEDITRRGLTLRILVHEGFRYSAPALAYERRMLALGAQVRTAPVLPLRLLIVDRSSAMVPFDPASPGGSALMTTAPGLVQALCELFDRCWEDATPLEETLHPDETTGLTDSETELLKILSGGLTDEAAAKRLGVSVRTVKRRMEDLMRRLDAGSRFEAGVQAARRGWL